MILVTLVGQGLTLPIVIRALGLAHAGRRERQAERAEEFKARRQAVTAASERLERLAESRKLPEAVVRPLPPASARSTRIIWSTASMATTASAESWPSWATSVELTLIAAERDLVNELYRDGKLKDEGAPPDRTRARSARYAPRQPALERNESGSARLPEWRTREEPRINVNKRQ